MAARDNMGWGRWNVLLQSGCQEGTELKRVWNAMVKEGSEAAEWLGPEVEVFTTNIEGVGGSSVSGETRGLLVEAMEMNRSLLLSRAL